MLFNKEKNKKNLGFDDTWFVIIGVLFISFTIDYIFNNSFGKNPFYTALVSWSISLFFTICNWMFMRTILIWLRKRLPGIDETVKRILFLFLFMVSSIVLIDFIGNMIFNQLHGAAYNPIDRSRLLIPILLISTMLQAIYEAIYHHEKLKLAIRKEEQSKQMIIQSQLDAFKNQAKPHFLFNTLNTLRDIIDTSPKEQASEFVDKISIVYRYILESGNENLCPLAEELAFCESYIHIQKERFGDNLNVNMDVPANYHNKMIIPMGVQVLLENAIKHNVISNAKPLDIHITVENDFIIVTNKLQTKTSSLPSTKLGLKNITKRYALLSDTLPIIENNGETFKVGLPLLNPSNETQL